MKYYLLPTLVIFFLFGCSENDSYFERLLNADAENESWLLHGRTYDESRFSPLNDINDSNVGELGLSWSFETGTNRGHETTPIVVDGMMFISAPWSMVFALDPKTGVTLIGAWAPLPPGDASHEKVTGIGLPAGTS